MTFGTRPFVIPILARTEEVLLADEFVEPARRSRAASGSAGFRFARRCSLKRSMACSPKAKESYYDNTTKNREFTVVFVVSSKPSW
jgi:hypothetical protein